MSIFDSFVSLGRPLHGAGRLLTITRISYPRMRLMTLSHRKIYLVLALLAASAVAFAATPPTAEMAAAQAAIASAERAQPRGEAAQALDEAHQLYAQAQAAMAKKKYKDALRWADEAHASADLAGARARLANARIEVEEKSARNADLRRQLLVVPQR
ncbi:DUF4398 domain-containing protein [Arenimonas oryziterrae]|nr:DUF4398 domain-containing protein [Arenimonas oryziterrae]